MLDEDPDLDFAGCEPNDFHQTLLHAGGREVSVEDIENWWRKPIPTQVAKSFIRRKLLNRFCLVTNQERVAAVALRTRWW